MTVVLGVSLFLVGVQLAGSAAQITTTAAAYGIAGLVLIAVFIYWETRVPEPIIPLFLFRNRVFTVANLLGFITGGVMFGALIFLPLYFQTVRGLSPTASGLRLLPMLAGMLLMSITTGRLVSRFGRYKMFVVAGTAVLATALGLMSMITLTTGAWVIAGMLFLVGVGLGLFMQTLILAVQNALPREYMGTGTATVTFFRTLGGAIGSAVLGAVLVAAGEDQRGPLRRECTGPRSGPCRPSPTGWTGRSCTPCRWRCWHSCSRSCCARCG